MKSNILILLIFISALIIRLVGINWDQGFHLHPDERMLIMVAERINFFNQLNPDFFNYGSLPIYILKGTAQLIDFFFNLNIANYQNLLYLGRFLSLIFDLFTLTLIYKITFLLFPNNKKVALFSSFFYAFSFFPIQNSHFFISDVFLNSFTTLLIYHCLKISKIYFENNRLKNPVFRFIFLGLNLSLLTATKFTGVIFYPLVLFLIFALILKFSKNSLINKLKDFLLFTIAFNLSFLIFNFLFMPYTFLEYKKFLNDISAQMQMNNNPYIFPYTLQYVNTLPYLYYLKNIFLWGLGPIISFLSFIGLFLFFNKILKIKNLKHNKKNKKNIYIANMYFLFFVFYILYFLILGRSAVKFMRYMLPIYPFLTIMAGYGISKIQNLKLKIINFKIFSFFLILGSIFWLLLFINIYFKKHTRIAATEWIVQNLPSGSTLAIEHWDDRLPLYGNENYNFIELTLYDLPDDENKWSILKQKISAADYIIIASNRLYIPLQKLANCRKFKICYPKTAHYYKNLFDEKLGFKKIAEFSVYPSLSIFNFQFSINDQSADESFSVYDHPKVIIFGK